MHDAWSSDIRQSLNGYRNTALLLLPVLSPVVSAAATDAT